MNGLNNRPSRHPVFKPRILPDFQAVMRKQNTFVRRAAHGNKVRLRPILVVSRQVVFTALSGEYRP